MNVVVDFNALLELVGMAEAMFCRLHEVDGSSLTETLNLGISAARGRAKFSEVMYFDVVDKSIVDLMAEKRQDGDRGRHHCAEGCDRGDDERGE